MKKPVRSTRFAAILATGIAFPASASPLDLPGLLAWWALDGDALDASGQGHDAVSIQGGVTPTTDRFGDPNGAMAFDGTGLIVMPGLDHDVTDHNSFTAAAWIRPDAASGAMVFDVQGSGTTAKQTIVNIASTGIKWYANGDSGSPSCSNCWGMGSSSFLTPGQWTHIAGVWEQTGPTELTVSLYVNGGLVGTRVSGLLRNDYGWAGWFNPLIGGYSWGGADFVGAVDDAVIYSRALSSTEIAHLAAVPLPAAAWLFGSGLLGLVAVARRRSPKPERKANPHNPMGEEEEP